MAKLLTAAQMRAVEQAATSSGQASGLQLMERAGQGVVDAIFTKWPEFRGQRNDQAQFGDRAPLGATILCGPGNNGGDGFVVARLLSDLGWRVHVLLFGNPDNLPPDAHTNCERWRGDHPIHPFSAAALAEAPQPDLLIDAVFGTGLTRKVEGELAQVLDTLEVMRRTQGVRVVAIDTPSGMCSDSGKALGVFATADLTVSFHSAKQGHYLNRGPFQCGDLDVRGIGLDSNAPEKSKEIVSLVESPGGQISKQVDGHKYLQGHALVLCGGTGRTGAARLAARGALRIGAGLVTLGVPEAAIPEVAGQVTALMMAYVEDPGELSETLKDTRLNALCAGPGLGFDRARQVVPILLAAKRPTVLDADALSAYASNPAELFDRLHDACILTPHEGEYARLFPDIAERLSRPADTGPAYSKVEATRAAAERAGCVVLFKGPDTVIATPNGQCSISSGFYQRAAPWLATAGSGDVLAGFATGLLARGFAPMDAAEFAAWLHVECARSFGPGLIAEDLPEQVPAVFRRLSN